MVRELQQGRAKQLRVALTRLESPRKADGGLGRKTDRRTLAKQEATQEKQKVWLEARQAAHVEALQLLPPCPECQATFSTKTNLLKHIR